MNKRMIYGTIIGAVLGVFCIVGALTRYSENPTTLYLFSFWFNRVLIGLFIGLLVPLKDWKYLLIRGLFVGLFISFAFYSATNFFDTTGFKAGGIYGIITEVILLKIKDLGGNYERSNI